MRTLLAIIALDLTVLTGIVAYEFVEALTAPPEVAFSIKPQGREDRQAPGARRYDMKLETDCDMMRVCEWVEVCS